MPPSILLCIILAIGMPVTYGVMKVKMHSAVSAAYSKGVRDGKALAAAETTARSMATMRALEAGSDAAPDVPEDKAKIIDLCRRSASCRDRKRGAK